MRKLTAREMIFDVLNDGRFWTNEAIKREIEKRFFDDKGNGIVVQNNTINRELNEENAADLVYRQMVKSKDKHYKEYRLIKPLTKEEKLRKAINAIIIEYPDDHVEVAKIKRQLEMCRL